MVWTSGGVETLHEYVRLACGGADPQLFPTLLGLRLLDDPLYGLRKPRNMMAIFGKADLHDCLEWAPAPLVPAAPPAAAPGDGITAAMAGWGDLACLCKAAPRRDRSALHLLTPLTLLHLLAGLGGRARALVPPGTATWRQLADELADACGIPETHRLALRTLCCWALRRPGQPGPLLAPGRVPLSREYRQSAQEGRNLLLSLHLAALPRGGSTAGLLAAVQCALAGGLQNLHVIDVLGFDVESEEVGGVRGVFRWRCMPACATDRLTALRVCYSPAQLSFLLPPAHGLDPEGTGLALV